MIRTRFTEMFGLSYPVMSAPMASHSGGTLAGAVSAAGGLGSFGGHHSRRTGTDWIRAEIEIIRAVTDRAFGVGFITPFLRPDHPGFEATLAEHPPVVALSFADPAPFAARAKAVGAKVMCQVQTYADVELAMAAGADVLVAQGNEAGGHTGLMGLLPFLVGVTTRYPDVPVLAAGGIANGRTLAAALVAGADGAWVGTAFMATPEAVEVHETHKRLIVDSDGTDTVFSRAYDIVSGLPWPKEIGERIRRNGFTDEWANRETELRALGSAVVSPSRPRSVSEPLDIETSELHYGLSARFVPAIRPAAEVLQSMCDDAQQILRARPAELLA